MGRELFSNISKLGLLLLTGATLSGCIYDYQTWGIDVSELQSQPQQHAQPQLLSAQNTSQPQQPNSIPSPIPAPSPETTASIPPSSGTSRDPNMAAWLAAYSAYDKEATVYWNRVSELRKVRNSKRANKQTVLLTDYVLTQPPVYKGPPRPQSNSQTSVQKTSIPKMERFIAASQKVYNFKPERPRNEAEFMHAYARAAREIGFTREQLVGIYAFETGGNGTHDLQAGMLNANADTQPISTAVGYNQLVATASVSLMWEYGKAIATELRARGNASANSAEKARLYKKAQVVDQMTMAAKTVPHRWSAQGELAKKPAGMGIHAATLDKDIGPLLQVHKLRSSMQFLRRKGIVKPLNGAELEMLNLTGDGNGYDMVTMPLNYRDKVPTSNFFLRNGYERNPVAKKNNTVAALLKATEDKIASNMRGEGAQKLYNAFSNKK